MLIDTSQDQLSIQLQKRWKLDFYTIKSDNYKMLSLYLKWDQVKFTDFVTK